ncbi:MAG: hypothetical protein KDD45_17285, partial [Bdellovibrionales bacterium]|nr:hypothetical protein [Bdellovibrionales bacterium]
MFKKISIFAFFIAAGVLFLFSKILLSIIFLMIALISLFAFFLIKKSLNLTSTHQTQHLAQEKKKKKLLF